MEVKTKQKSGKEHNMEKPELLSGNEKFCLNGIELGFTVRDYWQFQFSNLIDNLGYVAEFLVAKAYIAARTKQTRLCVSLKLLRTAVGDIQCR